MTPHIVHVSDETAWNGSAQQLVLLARHLEGTDQTYNVRTGSRLAAVLPAGSTVAHPAMGYLAPRSAWTIKPQLRTGQAESLLHARTGKGIETAIAARLLRKVPLMVERRSVDPIDAGWMYRQANIVVAASHAVEQHLVDAGVARERIRVINPAVDIAAIQDVSPTRAGLPASAVMVFCGAAFLKEKGHDTLLRAWKAAELDAARCVLVLAGDGPELETIRQMVANLALRNVTFLGKRDDIHALTMGCDVAVLASRSEAFSTFLSEAQWCGKPIVATSSSGLAETILDRKTALLSPPDDIAQLAAHLRVLCQNATLRNQFGAMARELALMRLHPVRMADQYRQAYDDAVEHFIAR